jgi:hypothetical protein
MNSQPLGCQGEASLGGRGIKDWAVTMALGANFLKVFAKYDIKR